MNDRTWRGPTKERRQRERACKDGFEAPQGGSRVKLCWKVVDAKLPRSSEVERGRDGFVASYRSVHSTTTTESAMLRANAGKCADTHARHAAQLITA